MNKTMIPVERLENIIYVIRGQRVIFDHNLANLYGVLTKALIQAVKRNIKRFPEDFMFQLSKHELENWRSQIVTSNPRTRMSLRRRPYVFTEHGAVMAANILRSEWAITMSIEVVRAFVRMRYVLVANEKLSKELQELRSFVLKRFHKTDQEFARLWKSIEKLINPPVNTNRIGFDLSQNQ